MYEGVDHIGIAVKNLDEAVHIYRDILGFELKGSHILKERKVKVAFFSSGGASRIELLEPLDKDTAIGKFLEGRGEGIHHFAVRVSNIETALEELRQKRAILIDEKPQKGAEGAKIAFVHPKSAKGVLLELVERH